MPSHGEPPVGGAPVADLVIELRRPRMTVRDGSERASARLQVRFEPASARRSCVESAWMDAEAPLGPKEAAELRWYLEEYPHWPFGVRRTRATKVEASLASWGGRLFDVTLGRSEAARAVNAWKKVTRAARRITVLVAGDDREEPDEQEDAAGARLLALPWELLHDHRGYLVGAGARSSVSLRRRWWGDAQPAALPASSPLRVLFVLSRPEGGSLGFLEPRASLIAVSEALGAVGGGVELTVAPDGSLDGLLHMLDQAITDHRPYSVVHFDGHGLFDPVARSGHLCFEDPDDVRQGALARRMDNVPAETIGELLRERRVSLFVLEACQTARTEDRTRASVAAALLRAGVGSVVAASHSMLVSTARRFVEVFYGALARGDRVGDAFVAAQKALRSRGHDRDQARTHRRDRHSRALRSFQDWFVPVLFQQGPSDPALAPSAAGRRGRARSPASVAPLPGEPPDPAFVGRGRALLAIERTFQRVQLLTLVGPAGLGKTALAAEAARWALAARRVGRVAFTSVERSTPPQEALDALVQELADGDEPHLSGADAPATRTLEDSLSRLERALAATGTMIVVDDMESLCPPPGAELDSSARSFFSALQRLSRIGGTRVLLLSRESLPEPLDRAELRLGELPREEALEERDFAVALGLGEALRARADIDDNMYPGIEYDRAIARVQLGRALRMAGHAEAALGPLRDAEQRLSDLARGGDASAALMEGPRHDRAR